MNDYDKATEVAWERATFIFSHGRPWCMSGIIWWAAAWHDFWAQVAIAALHEIITACAELAEPVFAEKEWCLTDPDERLEAILYQTAGASRLA